MSIVSITAILLAAGPAPRQDVSAYTAEQVAIVYDQCLARAAVRASRTDAAEDAIYGIAKIECAATRASLLRGREADKPLVDVLTAIDRDKQASFPALTKKVRERRRAFEAEMAAPK